MNIIIDDRESAVIPFINIQKKANPGITFEVKRINIGDYALCHGSNIKAIIEFLSKYCLINLRQSSSSNK